MRSIELIHSVSKLHKHFKGFSKVYQPLQFRYLKIFLSICLINFEESSAVRPEKSFWVVLGYIDVVSFFPSAFMCKSYDCKYSDATTRSRAVPLRAPKRTSARCAIWGMVLCGLM